MKLATLEDAIHRMTNGPARQFGLSDRGSIEVGKAADLVIFNLDTIGTAVAPSRIKELPTGISHVMINGTMVVADGGATNACPGVVGLRH
jgi:N-acyl-D-amino-acid deacylase